MSFDIKFTRQGFEKAYWHREACVISALLHVLRQNWYSEKKIFFGEIITSDPSIYRKDHPDITVSNFTLLQTRYVLSIALHLVAMENWSDLIILFTLSVGVFMEKSIGWQGVNVLKHFFFQIGTFCCLHKIPSEYLYNSTYYKMCMWAN